MRGFRRRSVDPRTLTVSPDNGFQISGYDKDELLEILAVLKNSNADLMNPDLPDRPKDDNGGYA